MPEHESASAVYSGVLHDTPAGAIAVWVTRNGVRRITGVTPEMIEEGHWDPEGHQTLRVALHQLQQYFSRNRQRFHLPLDFSGATEFQKRIFERLSRFPMAVSCRTGTSPTRSGWPAQRGPSARPWGPTPFRSSFRAIASSEATASWGLLRGPSTESRPPRHRRRGRRRAQIGKSSPSGAAAASALDGPHLTARSQNRQPNRSSPSSGATRDPASTPVVTLGSGRVTSAIGSNPK